MTEQLVLPMGVDDAPSLDNFLDTPNRDLMAYLKQQLLKRASGHLDAFTGILVYGDPGSGKSHLDAALVEWVAECRGEALRLNSLKDLKRVSVLVERNQVYLLDDLEAFLGDALTERELLTFIERLKQHKAGLVMFARRSVNGLGVRLADLRSRLQAMESFELCALDENEKRLVLSRRARQRGILLSEEVLNWLFTHTGRELGTLFDLLERIDVLSLAEKRRVTIPLIKSMLGERHD